MRGRWLGAAAVASALLAAPGVAQGQGAYGPFQPQEEYPPGITVSGGGLARVAAPDRRSEESVEAAVQAAKPLAVGRAIRDARRRAEALATELGIAVGATRQIEVREPFFEQRRRCGRRARPGRSACLVPAFTAAATTVTFAIAGGSDPDEDADAVEAYGSALVPVDPADPGSERSIRQSLRKARDQATPDATARARAQADSAADAAGMSIGAPVAVVEQNSFYPDVSLGAFGARRYCRAVRSRRFLGLDPDTGRPRIRRGPARRRCFFPRRLSISVEITYTLAPPPS